MEAKYIKNTRTVYTHTHTLTYIHACICTYSHAFVNIHRYMYTHICRERERALFLPSECLYLEFERGDSVGKGAETSP